MANEVQVIAQLSYSNTGVPLESVGSTTALNVSVSSVPYMKGVQTIGFGAAEALSLGDVAAPGYVIIKNLDSTHFVSFMRSAGIASTAAGKISPGNVAVFELATTALYLIADTAAVNILYLVVPS